MFVKIYAMTVLKLRLPVIVVLRGIMEHRQTAQADAQSVPVLELPPQAAQVLQDVMFLLAQQVLILRGRLHIHLNAIGLTNKSALTADFYFLKPIRTRYLYVM